MQVVWLSVICTATVLGLFHGLVWVRQRLRIEHGLIALLGLLTAASGVLEMRAFSATATAEYADSLRWAHSVAQAIVLIIIAYVQLTIPGRPWLALIAAALRIPILVVNQTTGVGLSFLSIDELHRVTTLGGATFATPVGTPNPWFGLAFLANLVVVVFLVDRAVSLRRMAPSRLRSRGLQTLAALVIIALIGISTGVASVQFAAPVPMTVSIGFLAFALVATHQLALDLLQAHDLALQVRASSQTLDEVRSNLRLAEDSARLGIWQWDAGSKLIRLSDRSAEILGRESATEVKVEWLLTTLDPADWRRARETLAGFVEGGDGEFAGQFRVLTATGARRWVAVHGRLLRDAKDTLVRANGVIFDVTDHRSNDAIFGVVFESSPSAMLLVDERGQITLANETAAELSGYPVAELVGMSIDALVPPEAQEVHHLHRRSYATAAARRQMLPRREVRLLRRDGQHTAVEVTLNPVTVDGQVLVIATVLDISRRQQQEREQSMQRAALAHVARVGMLAELSGSLAHEINQPLAAILSNAQASRRFIGHAPPNLEEVREGLNEIVVSAKRAGDVIRKLRAMLRNEQPDFVALDVNQTIREVVQFLHSELIDRHVRIVESLADGLPPVRGDRVQLQQVVLNLITNAADAMAGVEGTRRITLTTRSTADGVLVEVADAGSGIAEENLGQIFQAFVTTKANGLGLGLPLCMTLVQAHGGKLWASNNVGPGATFHVLLPAAG